MPEFGQLLHDEEFRWKAQPYRLFVFRADGGIVGRWQCGTCDSEHDHDDCRAFSSVNGCLGSMKRAISEHHHAAAATRKSCPQCPE